MEWLTDSKLKDLDFADGIALLDVSIKGMQDLTTKVEDAAKLGVYMRMLEKQR